MLGVYARPKMAILLLLGFSSGLPLFLVRGRTLAAWLTDAGVTTSVIGLFSLLALPYSFKFLWSPFLDRYTIPFPGSLGRSRRRGWLVLSQILLLIGLLIMSLQDPLRGPVFTLNIIGIEDPVEGPLNLMVIGFIVAFLGATQDIVVDAYRTDSLTERETGAGVAVFVNGYRIALWITGAVALFLADRIPWNQVYGLMAILMVVGLITTLFAPEPDLETAPPQSLSEAVVQPFLAFAHQYSWLRTSLILGFILIFQLADGLAGTMTTTFLKEGVNFSNTDLSLYLGTFGFFATVGGTFLGGFVVSGLGLYRALFFSSLMQGLSNAGFAAIALIGKNYLALASGILIENVAGGISTASFLAFLMNLCDQRYSATQYALFTSLFSIGGVISGSVSGFMEEQLGWTNFFLVSMLGALPGAILLIILGPSVIRVKATDPIESAVAQDP